MSTETSGSWQNSKEDISASIKPLKPQTVESLSKAIRQKLPQHKFVKTSEQMCKTFLTILF